MHQNIIKQVKRQTTHREWEKIFLNHISSKKINTQNIKNSYNLTTKNSNPIQNVQKLE